MSRALVWFRNDLRLDDNPALQAALDAGLAPVPIYVHAPEEEGGWPPGAASDAWRHRSLAVLDAELRSRGSRLRYFRGPSSTTLEKLAAEASAVAVFWNRRYEPAIVERDGRIKRDLRRLGLRVESFNGSLLIEPWEVRTGTGDPYRVFTPFWRAARAALRLTESRGAPSELPEVPVELSDLPLDALGLAPRTRWDSGFWEEWSPGERGALAALDAFVRNPADRYAALRDRPDLRGTSRLSPHLHFGEIAPWRVMNALLETRGVAGNDAAGGASDIDAGAESYLRELGWREFAYHVLHHFPRTPDSNFNPRFDDFQWSDPPEAVLDAWYHGRTGLPIVDAGMRELWATGWMHNRVRMIVASLLSKNLRVHWSVGARWFWDTLVDADLANNTLGWQWVAGTGVDAAPYFRIFNPVTQSRRFDPRGDYIARWVPELARLPVELRRAPWLDRDAVQSCAPGYPSGPLVDLNSSRASALETYRQLERHRVASSPRP
jgi:deoxyribodipyrimidine photo-lyase